MESESSKSAITACLGAIVATIWLRDNALSIGFADGRKLRIADEGQNCCERRYASTDDDLQSVVGGEFRGAEVRAAGEPEGCDCGESHEVCVLIVQTSKGDVTVANHNEHNGYYGGFCMNASVEAP